MLASIHSALHPSVLGFSRAYEQWPNSSLVHKTMYLFDLRAIDALERLSAYARNRVLTAVLTMYARETTSLQVYECANIKVR